MNDAHSPAGRIGESTRCADSLEERHTLAEIVATGVAHSSVNVDGRLDLSLSTVGRR